MQRAPHPPAAERGITLVEILVSIAIFASLGVGIYAFFDGMLSAIQGARTRLNATALLREQLEIVRNLPYADVGISGSIPDGVLEHARTVEHGGQTFVITTTIRNVDHPFDGTIGGSPNDLSPADHKLVEIEVSCPTCRTGRLPIRFTTTQAPKGLETASTNGALFVQVIDSAGLPVPAAQVMLTNRQMEPHIVIDDVTGNDGWLRIVDAPPGTTAYEMTVSKPGYSMDQTFAPGADGNPDPAKPHATVAVQTVTQITFAIDRTSTVEVSSVTESCAPVPNVGFSLTGAKTVGAPSVLKYAEQHATSGAGTLTLADMEWDSYAIALLGSASSLRGLIPLNPLSLAAGTVQTLRLIVGAAEPNALLVTVKDAATLLPIPDATVTLSGNGSRMTGRGHLGQTDWSGGAGQDLLDDPTRFFETDGNIAYDSPAGELKLFETFDGFVPSGVLTSSTIDTGSESNFHELVWEPLPQPAAAGEHPVRFHVATIADDGGEDAEWEFLGPDGTPGTFYTAENRTIASAHDGDRFLRYRVFLTTEDPEHTPSVSDVNFTFTSSCVPPGQATFGGLSNGTYELTVEKAGYQTFTDDGIGVNAPWSERVVILTPS